MDTFFAHHRKSIRFRYRCFDRILLNALIQPFQQPERVVGFFGSYRKLYPVSRDILRGIAERFQNWVSNRALKWGVPIVEAPRGRRDEFVDPYFRRAKPDQVAVILKAREPARIMIAIGNKQDNRWHLQIAQRWVQQHNFYVNNRRWDRMFVRLCPYLPFSARVYFNQHHWLANRLRQEGIQFQQCSNAFLNCKDPQTPARAGRLPEQPRPVDLRPQVAGCLHAVLHRPGAPTGRVPTSLVFRSSGVLRQPRLPSSRRSGSTRRASVGCQPHHRPAQQDHHHLWTQGDQAVSGQAADRPPRAAQSPSGTGITFIFPNHRADE